METATLYFSLMYACQALLAVYGGFQSFLAIQNLRQYEATTKKLAKWSKTVEDQLWNTRKTQGAGAVTVSHLPSPPLPAPPLPTGPSTRTRISDV